MAPSIISYSCRSCSQHIAVTPKRTFLGFRKAKCPHCQQIETFPLTRGYRATYLLVVALVILTILMAVSRDEIGFPGLLGALVIAALIIDLRLKKKTQHL